jgi:choline dehydrogenase-like flavoprotein
MISSMKWLMALGVGLAGGWAARSLSDSPEGAGVKLLELGIKAKDQVDRWAAVERERLDDMMAEARSNISREKEAANKSGHKSQPGNKRETRLVKLEERA